MGKKRVANYPPKNVKAITRFFSMFSSFYGCNFSLLKNLRMRFQYSKQPADAISVFYTTYGCDFSIQYNLRISIQYSL